MAENSVTATFHCNIERLWNAVTSLTTYAWRTDISRIESVNPFSYVEYASGISSQSTTVNITAKEENQRYEVNIDNDTMAGHKKMLFSKVDNATSTIMFSEEITPKKLSFKPFADSYLKKYQKQYLEDLKQFVEPRR